MPRGGPGKKRKPGGGAKPKMVGKFRREHVESKLAEAEYAFALLCDTMRDEREETTVRLLAADKVLDRVLGKPKQTTIIADWRLEAERLGINPELLKERLTVGILGELEDHHGSIEGQASPLDNNVSND